WLRSHLFRTALATCFQDAAALAELAKLESVEIRHAQGHRLAGLLLAAWIGVRLKCRLESSKGEIRLMAPRGNAMRISLIDGGEGEALQRVQLKSSGAMFSVSRDCGAAYVCTSIHIGNHSHEEMLPADLVSDSEIIAEQLSRLGGQSLYVQIVPML